MFTSFDEKVFRQAIAEKDFLRLKINAVSAISYDPTFEKGEAAAVLNILQKEVPEIFEEYEEGDYEERLDKSQWDKRYFSKLLYWFQENFSKDRIPLIKEVGKAVHVSVPKPTVERKPVSNSSGPVKKSEGMQKQANFTQAPEKKSSIVGILVVAGVVVLIIALLLKIFVK